MNSSTAEGAIADRWRQLHQRINDLCLRIGRNAESVEVVAVSKTHSVAAITQAWNTGQRHFGENYWQEMETKIEALAGHDIVWHFIGRLQSRKARAMADKVDWVHGISRLKTAAHLNQGRSAEKAPLNVCLQINLFGERQKDGIDASEAKALAEEVAALERLRLRGLMTILPYGLDATTAQAGFERLSQLRQQLCTDAIALDTLSMGMSQDWQAAVCAGSTLIRVGSAIFGTRVNSPATGADAGTTPAISATQ